MKEIISGNRVGIVSSSLLAAVAREAAARLISQGIPAGVIDLPAIDTFDADSFLKLTRNYKMLVVLEKDGADDGVGSIIRNIYPNAGGSCRISRMALSGRATTDGNGGLTVSPDQIADRISLILEQDSARTVEVSSTGIVAPANESEMDHVLDEESFALLLGVDRSEIGAECGRFIADTDFRYRFLGPLEKDNVLHESLQRLEDGAFSPSGPHRKETWEKGWSESLNAFRESGGDTAQLIPRFVRRNAVMRLNGEYIISSNPDFETAFVTVMRMVLFRKYFARSRAIFEFGCGTGHNLLAAAEMYPDKIFHGLDWSQSSCAIIEQLRGTRQLDIHGHQFDMYEPDNSIELGEKDAVLTVGALEQLGTGFTPFLTFLLSKQPQICLHLETMNEIYTRRTAADFITLQYHRQRRYLTGFLEALREHERQGRLRIMQVQRAFGGQYHEGYSFVAWYPTSRRQA